MRTKVTLVLLFLNVVLFYYIFHYEEKWRDEQRLLEARRRVLGPESAAIENLTLAARSAPTVRAEKRSDGWWLTQPVEWPANPNALTRLVNELQFLEHFASWAVSDLAKSGQTLADYGLADPAYTLAFTASGKTYELKVGDNTQAENRLYLLSPDGKRIHVVARSLADTLSLPLEDLRSPSIFTVPVFEVRSLGLQTTTPASLKVRLRKENTRWSFETPILARANKAAVETAINALNGLQTGRFLESRDADLERTGLADPSLRITLEGNSRRETLLLGAPVNTSTAGQASTEFYAKIEDKPAIFTTTIAKDLIDDLRAAQEKLRDAHLLDFNPAAVTALTLNAPGQGELALQKLEAATAAPVSEGWQIVTRGAAGQAPQTIPADPQLVQELIAKLATLTARKFLTDAPSAADLETYGFNRPERQITLSLSSGGGPAQNEPSALELQIGISPGQSGTAYARLGNAPFIYQIDPEILTQIPVLVRHYRHRVVRELPAGARLTGIKLTELPAERVVVQADNPAELTAESLASSSLPEALRPALATLIAESRLLRARQFTADGFDADQALYDGRAYPWKYRLDLTIALSGGGDQSTTSSIFLTERIGGAVQLAGTRDLGGLTFSLTQELVDALHAYLYAPAHDPGPPSDKATAAPAAPNSPKP